MKNYTMRLFALLLALVLALSLTACANDSDDEPDHGSANGSLNGGSKDNDTPAETTPRPMTMPPVGKWEALPMASVTLSPCWFPRNSPFTVTLGTRRTPTLSALRNLTGHISICTTSQRKMK